MATIADNGTRFSARHAGERITAADELRSWGPSLMTFMPMRINALLHGASAGRLGLLQPLQNATSDTFRPARSDVADDRVRDGLDAIALQVKQRALSCLGRYQSRLETVDLPRLSSSR